MKIASKIFKNHLKKIKLNGICTVKEAIFDFRDDGMYMSALTGGNTTQIESCLKKNSFIEYDAIGKIGVQVIPSIHKLMDKFENVVEITVEGNLLRIKGECKKLEIELVDTQFIEPVKDLPKLEWQEKFSMAGQKLKEYINDILVNDTTNDDISVFISTTKGRLTLSNTGMFKFTTDIESSDINGGVKVKFGEPFLDTCDMFTDKVDVNIATDYPMLIVEETDDYLIKLLIAPRVEND